MSDKAYVTVREAAMAWGVSSRTVFRWIEQGKVQATRRGQLTYVDPDRPPERVAVIVPSKERHDLARQGGAGTMAHVELTRARRATFRWQVAAASALVATFLLSSLLLVGWGLYRGRAGELAARVQSLALASTSLAAERLRVVGAERRATQARVEAQLTRRRLSEALDRNIELAQAAADMILDLDYAETVGR